MSTNNIDIATMLDDLNLPLASARWKEITQSPIFSDYTALQLFREVLEAQYLETVRVRRD